MLIVEKTFLINGKTLQLTKIHKNLSFDACVGLHLDQENCATETKTVKAI